MKKNHLIILAFGLVILFIALAGKNLMAKKDEAHSAREQKNKSLNAKEINNSGQDLLQISAHDFVLGDKNAPVTIIEYASFSCPHCAVFYQDGFAKLNEDYIKTGKAKFIYRDFPLNKPALFAASLALCNVKKDNVAKYYNNVKSLYKSQESWAFDENFLKKLENIAKLNGINEQDFKKCMGNIDEQKRILEGRLAAAKNLFVQSTPTFFINGQIISGYSGYSELRNIIEQKLR